VEEVVDLGDHLVPELDRLAHAVAAQVEVAVAEPQLLSDLAGEALDLERRRLRVGEELRPADEDLDLAGRHLGVDRLLRAPHDLALGADHVLGAQLVPELERAAGRVGVEDELDESGAIAEVDEHEPAVVAAPVDPARDALLRADAVAEHLAAPG